VGLRRERLLERKREPDQPDVPAERVRRRDSQCRGRQWRSIVLAEPATVPAGQMVVWHNVDNITHRVVLNDRSVDTGDLAPGTSSQPMAIAGDGQYHCSIHPVMVGSINQAASSPSCQGSYCE
jgi:hypothetical protein